MTPNQLFKSLEGKWHLSRKIELYTTNSVLKVKGEVSFVRVNNNKLNYQERCSLLLENGSEISSFRNYSYIYQEKQIQVLFENQQLFHKLLFVKPKLAIASHLCINDQYEAKYYFLSPDKFYVDYFVKGLSKHYHSRTIMRKT